MLQLLALKYFNCSSPHFSTIKRSVSLASEFGEPPKENIKNPDLHPKYSLWLALPPSISPSAVLFDQ